MNKIYFILSFLILGTFQTIFASGNKQQKSDNGVQINVSSPPHLGFTILTGQSSKSSESRFKTIENFTAEVYKLFGIDATGEEEKEIKSRIKDLYYIAIRSSEKVTLRGSENLVARMSLIDKKEARNVYKCIEIGNEKKENEALGFDRFAKDSTRQFMIFLSCMALRKKDRTNTQIKSELLKMIDLLRKKWTLRDLNNYGDYYFGEYPVIEERASKRARTEEK